MALTMRPIVVSAFIRDDETTTAATTGDATPARVAADGLASHDLGVSRVRSSGAAEPGVLAGMRRAAAGAWNAIAGDDLRTLADAHASVARRTLAVGDLALDLVPEGKIVDLGAKLAARAAAHGLASVGLRSTEHVAEGAAAREASPLFRGFAAEHLGSATGAERNADAVAQGFEPPWASEGEIRDGRLLDDDRDTFARVYRDTPDGSRTPPIGPWLLRRADIAGKTAAQIKDAYALPQEPTHAVDIHLKAGFRLRVGRSGPNAFGRGGSEQFQALDQPSKQNLGVVRRLP